MRYTANKVLLEKDFIHTVLDVFLEVLWEGIGGREDQEDVPADVPGEQLRGGGRGGQNNPADDAGHDERRDGGCSERGEELGDGGAEREEVDGADCHFGGFYAVRRIPGTFYVLYSKILRRQRWTTCPVEGGDCELSPRGRAFPP